MSGVFVGRERELERIRALDGLEGPAALVIVGDPGSGKSRLLVEGAAASQRHVFRVVGYEPERLVPLAAASDLLRAVAAGAAFESAPGTAIEPVRVFEAAHQALRALGRSLIVVDDVQWIDDLSLALLHYLVRAAVSADGDLHVLAAGRPAARTHGLADDLSTLLPPGRADALELSGLDRADGQRLARAIDATLGEGEAEALWERSGGLPFWIEVLARSSGGSAEAGRTLTSRLRGAGPDAEALVALLAVVGRPLREEAVLSLLGWPAGRAEAAADLLVARGLAGRERGSLRLAHDLIRSAAADELPDPRRRELHSAVARWLEREAQGDVGMLREALEHRSAAGEPATELALRLAASPQSRRLGLDGLHTLAKIADESEESDPATAELRRLVAALASELGEHELALERWAAIADRLGDSDERAAALLHASKAAFELGPAVPGRARELVDAAAAHARSEVTLARVRAHEARIRLWLEHETAAGAAFARQAVEMSDALPDGDEGRRARFESLRAAYEAAMQEDRGEEMVRLADRLHEESATDAARVDALISRGLAQRFTKPVPEATASLRVAAELAERRVLPTQSVDAGFWLAQCLHDLGDLPEAARVASAAHELAGRVGDVSRVRAHVARIRDKIALELGRQEEGLAGLAADARAEVDPHYRLGTRQTAAEFLSRAAGTRAAPAVGSLVELAAADAAASGCPRCTNEFRLKAAEALARVGLVDDAAAHMAATDAGGSDEPLPKLRRLTAHALLAAATGEADAVRLLEDACELAADSARGLDELWLRIDLGRALEPVDRERATAELRAVAARADDLGAAAARGVAERELRRLGVRTWRRGRTRAAAAELSEREREVAELVAGGASNPDIAQALFLSRKTVERHVSNVLAKLGVRNRTELAALLAREGEGAPR